MLVESDGNQYRNIAYFAAPGALQDYALYEASNQSIAYFTPKAVSQAPVILNVNAKFLFDKQKQEN